MTTQAITGTVWGGEGGRSYAVTATDGTYNNQMSTVTGSAQLGFAQTNQLIDHIQVTYTAGGCAWRIRNSVTQVTKRTGFGFKVGATGSPPYSGTIPAFTAAQDDVLEVYSVVAP